MLTVYPNFVNWELENIKVITFIGIEDTNKMQWQIKWTGAYDFYDTWKIIKIILLIKTKWQRKWTGVHDLCDSWKIMKIILLIKTKWQIKWTGVYDIYDTWKIMKLILLMKINICEKQARGNYQGTWPLWIQFSKSQSAIILTQTNPCKVSI